MIVPRSKLAEVEAVAQAGVEHRSLLVDPFDPATVLGPLVSAVQRDRVVGYIEKGIAEGARLVTGGPTAPDGLEEGFLRPTDRLLRRHAGHGDRGGGDFRLPFW